MATWLIVAIVVGSVAAYAVIGGVVYAIASRIEALDCAEDVTALFWPVAVPAVLLGTAGVWGGRWAIGAGERAVEAVIEWRRRPKVPRAVARRRRP
jgi:H+/Cl- antiporter ClcA